MVNLFLSEPKWNCDADNSSNMNVILPLLNKLGSHIQSLELDQKLDFGFVVLFLVISIFRRRQVNIFMRLLRSNPRKMQLVSQLLQLMFEKRPRKLGSALAKRSYLLDKFFEGNQKRILEWFAFDGRSDHKRGARALAQFAFANQKRILKWFSEFPKEHKRYNPRKLTYDERKASLIQRVKALNSAGDGGDDDEDEDDE